MSTSTALAGAAVSFNGVQLTVQPPCEEQSGEWACLTHGLTMPSPMMLHGHTQKRGAHVMVWLCPVHGLEAAPENE